MKIKSISTGFLTGSLTALSQIEITITDTTADLAGFEPVAGNYDLNLPSFDAGEIDQCQIENAIAANLAAKHGFAVNVELFRANGHAISNEVPSAGSFLVARK
jgi:hypothetical protein